MRTKGFGRETELKTLETSNFAVRKTYLDGWLWNF